MRAPSPAANSSPSLPYLDAGSHKAAAHRLGISESTCGQRVSQLIRRVGARNAAQAAWRLRHDLEGEGSGAPLVAGPATTAKTLGPRHTAVGMQRRRVIRGGLSPDHPTPFGTG